MNHRTHVEATNKSFRTHDGGIMRAEQVRDYQSESEASPATTAQNIIYLVYGLIAGILGIRLLLTLFIANRHNPFADFVYTITGPLVAPFRTLFGVDTRIGENGSRFELETLVAIVVYGLLAWAIVRLIRVREDTPEE